MAGENCSSSCLTKDHETFGACLRGKSLKVAFCGIGGGDASEQKRFDSDLQAYRDARAQGIQPASSDRKAVDRAVALSDAAGKAYQA